MLVKMSNYREYMDDLIERHQEAIVEYEHHKQERAKEYESKGLAKLFGWKFKDSSEYRHDWWCYNYGHLSRCRQEINRILYHTKLGDPMIEFNSDRFDIDAFYSFCRKRGLP